MRPTNPNIEKHTGLRRLFKAFFYSIDGLKAAFQSEEAFRLEVALAVVLIPVAAIVSVTPAERALLIGSVLIVMIVELINSALEALVDRISLERHPLSKQIKDVGSAAVLIAVALFLVTWGVILFPR